MSWEISMKPGFDHIGITCSFFCHDGKGNILFQKRSTQCSDEHGRWDCGGGKMEFGETIEETVRRELMEEYGVEAIHIQYIGTRNLLREHEGQPTHWLNNIHFVQIDPDTVKIMEPHKVDEYGWFTLDDLPEPLHSAIEEDIEMITNFFEKEKRLR